MRGFCTQLWQDRQGATALMVALLIPMLMGAVGLAVDVNLLFLQQHRLQIAADTAAFTAAMMLSNATARANSPTAFNTLAANAVTGITAGNLIGTSVVTQAVPTADFSTVTVTVTSTQTSLFTAVLGMTAFNMSATATAGTVVAGPCIVALAPSADNAITASGASPITATGCSVFSDSTSSTNSISVSGSGSVTGTSINAMGGTSSSNGGTFSPAPVKATTALKATAITLPSYNATCTATGYTLNFGAWPAGTYCGDTTLGGWNEAITLSGIYYIVNGSLTFNSSQVTASGVTLVFVGTSSRTLVWNNAAAGTFTPTTTGPLANVLIYQPCPGNGALSQMILSATGATTITGGIYLPCGILNMSNGSSLKTASGATASIEVNQISVVGGSTLSITGGGGGSSTVTLRN